MNLEFKEGDWVTVVAHFMDSHLKLELGAAYRIAGTDATARSQPYLLWYLESPPGGWDTWWVSEKCLAPLILENE